MTGNERHIEVEDYIVRSDGTVMRWMSADVFLERVAERDLEEEPSSRRYDVFKRMMESI